MGFGLFDIQYSYVVKQGMYRKYSYMEMRYLKSIKNEVKWTHDETNKSNYLCAAIFIYECHNQSLWTWVEYLPLQLVEY